MRKKTGRVAKPAGAVKTSFHLSRRILIDSAKLEPSDQYSVQLVRSLVVSFIAVFVNFAGSYLFKQKLGIYYLLAATMSFMLGVVVNYFLSIKWVFATRKLQSKHMEFAIFVVITTVGLVFNLLIIAGMVEILNVNYWTALITATIIVFFWNFLARKKVLY